VAKLFLILIFGGALAESLASAHKQPPLLIDAAHSAPARPAP
jgi:hypothetical protein